MVKKSYSSGKHKGFATKAGLLSTVNYYKTKEASKRKWGASGDPILGYGKRKGKRK